MAVDRREIRQLPKLPLALPCEIPAGFVALRDIAAHDSIRGVDIGKAPDVTAGAPVRVMVSTGGISITASAIALADGRAGDQIEVRMQRPARTLRTRVIGPGAVQLTDGN
jgi:flagella basal body P-ring formation protein FlgA